MEKRLIARKTNFIVVLFLWSSTLFLFTGCIDEIERGAFTFDRLLVVDGNISDVAKTHEIKLFFTTPVGSDLDDASNALTDAQVWIEDDLGNITDFTEFNEGTYLSPDNFAGERGRSYALFITTSEGKRYQSRFEELIEAPEIGEIYNRFKVESGDGEATSIPGVQFFMDADNADQSTQFFRYEWTDTHQIIVPFIKKYDYVIGPDGRGNIVPFTRDVRECYRESRFNELILATSTTNENGQLREVPIKFTGAYSLDVTTAYSLEVTQRAIGAEAYSYYRKIELFNESNGTLFDKQQGMIIGNITSIDDPDERVLGYFEVSGAKSKRVFLNISDLDEPVFDYLNRICSIYPSYQGYEKEVKDFYAAVDVEESLRGSEIAKRSFYELYDVYPGAGIYMAHRLCVDCTKRGSLGKPDYWP